MTIKMYKSLAAQWYWYYKLITLDSNKKSKITKVVSMFTMLWPGFSSSTNSSVKLRLVLHEISGNCDRILFLAQFSEVFKFQENRHFLVALRTQN